MVSRPASSPRVVLALLSAVAAAHARGGGAPPARRRLRTPVASAPSHSSSAEVPALDDARSLRAEDDGSSPDVPAVPTQRRRRAARDGGSSPDVPAVPVQRWLQETNTTATASPPPLVEAAFEAAWEVVRVPASCLAALVASADRQGQLKKENYFVFTDAMSNGYYSVVGDVTSYDDLPMNNKFGFVTLSCQCAQFGGRGNCCQGDRAKLDVKPIVDAANDRAGPGRVSEQMRAYVEDICRTTRESIGDNVLPDPRPTDGPPTGSPSGEATADDDGTPAPAPAGAAQPLPPITPFPTEAARPTAAPTPKTPDGAEKPDGAGDADGNDRPEDAAGGLGREAWIGMAVAGAGVLSLCVWLALGGRDRGEQDDEDDAAADRDLDLMARHDGDKELLAITNGGASSPEARPRLPRPGSPPSPDETKSLSESDASSCQSGRAPRDPERLKSSAYYAAHSLLPRPREDGSVLSLSSADGPGLFDDSERGDIALEEGVEVTDAPRSESAAGRRGWPPRAGDGVAADRAHLHRRPSLPHPTVTTPAVSAVPRPSASAGRRDTNWSTASSDAGSDFHLDRAIENGNWEAVAASAAAIVRENEEGQAMGHI